MEPKQEPEQAEWSAEEDDFKPPAKVEAASKAEKEKSEGDVDSDEWETNLEELTDKMAIKSSNAPIEAKEDTTLFDQEETKTDAPAQQKKKQPSNKPTPKVDEGSSIFN